MGSGVGTAVGAGVAAGAGVAVLTGAVGSAEGAAVAGGVGSKVPSGAMTEVIPPEVSELSGMLADGSDACVEALWNYASVSVNENGIGDVVYEAPERGESGNESGEFLDFVLDRPFLFVITGSDGLPLYVGVIYTVSD